MNNNLSIQAKWQTHPGQQIRFCMSRWEESTHCSLGYWYKTAHGWEISQGNNIEFPIESLDTVLELLSDCADQLRVFNEAEMCEEERWEQEMWERKMREDDMWEEEA